MKTSSTASFLRLQQAGSGRTQHDSSYFYYIIL